MTIRSSLIPLLLLVPVAAEAGARKEARPAPPPAPVEEANEPQDTELPDGIQSKTGPLTADLGNELQLQVPAGYVYLDRVNADRLMQKMGNFGNEDVLALVTKPDADWLVVFEFSKDGYVKDDEADKLDVDAILSAMKEGTEEENKVRVKQGFRPLHVVGWSEPPRYDRQKHQMIWGIEGKGESDEGKEERIVNHRTRVLGRYGVAALNLIDSPEGIAASKAEVAKLLAATEFKQGARYEDFDPSRDKVAEYGLAALVLGGAGAAAVKAVKIGLLAKFGLKLLAILVAGKKVIIIAVIALIALLGRALGRKKATRGTQVANAPQRPATPVAAAPGEVTTAPAQQAAAAPAQQAAAVATAPSPETAEGDNKPGHT